ncbi:MAG: 4Fe-4S binding protein [Candidatus Cloacimonadales bacterium]|nr:4Fe-4S binding protein [Candidatus Cloacimonadales bacterium]
MKKKYIFMIGIFVILTALLSISQSRIFVETNSCVGCGDCVDVCPVDAIQIVDGKSVIDAEKCILCEICIHSCTYDAIRKNK